MSAQNPFPAFTADTAVEMIEALGEWFVRVIEDGIEQIATFVTEAFAVAFAEGQRMRLGLESYTRF